MIEAVKTRKRDGTIGVVNDLPSLPKLNEIHQGLSAKSRQNLRRENRQILQKALAGIAASADPVAADVWPLRMTNYPWLRFSLSFCNDHHLLILAVESNGSKIFGSLRSRQERGREQALSIDDLHGLAEVRNAIIREHGALFGIN